MPAEQITIVQDEVVTGEAVALDVQPLGFFLRALGTFIDMLCAGALLLILALLSDWLLGASIVDVSGSGILSITMIVVATVVLPVTVETASRGRSVGKLVVGGRIVRADGGAIGFRQALIRALAGFLELWMSAGALAALVGAFTPRSQRLGDLMAGTYSQRTRTPRLPGEALAVPPMLTEWAALADVARLPDPLARRCAQFVRQAGAMDPAVRERFAQTLAAEAAEFVSPVPEVDASAFLYGVVAVRREREYASLVLEERRVRALIDPIPTAPVGFPQR